MSGILGFILIAGLSAQHVYRDGDPGVTAPRLIEKTVADYTDQAVEARLEGSVGVTFRVDEDATIHDIRVTHPLGLGLDEKAVEAVNQWKFEAGIKDGVAVPVLIHADVNFKILTGRYDWRANRANFDVPRGASEPILLNAEFPPAIDAENHASVVLSFDVDQNGGVIKVQMDPGSAERFESPFLDALRKWKFQPATKDGKPVVAHATFRFLAGQQVPSL